MAYDERLADRIRAVLGPRKGITERKMFGGLAFLLDGKMFCGVSGDELMVRVGPERHGEALAKKNVRPMDFTGRPMKGYVFVEPAGCKTEKAVEPWVEWSAAVVAALEPGKKGAAGGEVGRRPAHRGRPPAGRGRRRAPR